MGNLGDRIFRAPGLFRGDVVDWIGVVPRYYPIFNLADSAIVCGGILTVILAMRGYHLDGTRGEPEGDDAADAGAEAESPGAEQADADPADATAADTEPANGKPAWQADAAGRSGAARPSGRSDPAGPDKS